MRALYILIYVKNQLKMIPELMKEIFNKISYNCFYMPGWNINEYYI